MKLATAANEDGAPFDIVVLGSTWSKDHQLSIRNSLREDPALSAARFVFLTRDRENLGITDLVDTVFVASQPMRRSRFLTAVAVAAGRESPEVPEREEFIEIGDADVPTVEAAEAEGRLLLVAEDNETNRHVLRRQLNRLGYAAVFAEDGVEALDSWKTRNFALLLTDCHMPNMDGFELVAEIRDLEDAADTPLPIVAITANALRGEAERCLAAGMDDYLAKPVELAELKRALVKWMPTETGIETNEFKADGGGATTVTANPIYGDSVDENASPINRATLARLLGDDDSEYLNETLSFFWETMADTLGELRELMEARKASDLHEAAHAAKGAASSAAAERLSAILHELEGAAAREDWSSIDDLAPTVGKRFDEVERYINSIGAGVAD